MILGFKNQFAQAVANGSKPHTIRAGARWREGMSIQFYKNVRQKSMAKIREDAMVQVVQSITIARTPFDPNGSYKRPTITIDDYQLTPLECQELAQRDGFDSFSELLIWFDKTHGLPFTGQLVGWTNLRY